MKERKIEYRITRKMLYFHPEYSCDVFAYKKEEIYIEAYSEEQAQELAENSDNGKWSEVEE